MKTSSEHIGFIGLGNMGGAIALRLLRAGYPMTVLDLDQDKMKGLTNEGADAAATPREVAERSTVVLASLQPDVVEEVTCGKNGIAEAKRENLAFEQHDAGACCRSVRVFARARHRDARCAGERSRHWRNQRQLNDLCRRKLSDLSTLLTYSSTRRAYGHLFGKERQWTDRQTDQSNDAGHVRAGNL